jgi:hypothetical protein
MRIWRQETVVGVGRNGEGEIDGEEGGFDILLICFSASVFSHFLFGIPELFFEVYRLKYSYILNVLKKICRGESIDKKDKIGKIYNL